MITTNTTEAGKFFALVTKGGTVVYRTPDYYTEAMATADAECWAAFKGDNVTTYTLAIEDERYGRRSLGRVVKGKHVPTEYATKEAAWEAIKATSFAEPVSVLADGKPVASFAWMFKNPDEPVPGKPNLVRPVRDLCKWTRGGWEVTGVQAAGTGRYRIVRTVA